MTRDDTSIELTSSLKTLQKFVMENVERILEEESDDDTLTEVVKILIRARNEFWSPNVTTLLLYEIPNAADQGKSIGTRAKTSYQSRIFQAYHGPSLMVYKNGYSYMLVLHSFLQRNNGFIWPVNSCDVKLAKTLWLKNWPTCVKSRVKTRVLAPINLASTTE